MQTNSIGAHAILSEPDVDQLRAWRVELVSELETASAQAAAAELRAGEVRAMYERAWAEHGPQLRPGVGPEGAFLGLLDEIRVDWAASHGDYHAAARWAADLDARVAMVDSRIAVLEEKAAARTASPAEHSATIKRAERALQDADRRHESARAAYDLAQTARLSARAALDEATMEATTARARLADARLNAQLGGQTQSRSPRDMLASLRARVTGLGFAGAS